MTQVFFPETERGVSCVWGSGTDCRNRSDGCRAPSGAQRMYGSKWHRISPHRMRARPDIIH